MCLVCLLNEGIEAADTSKNRSARLLELPCDFGGHRLVREIAGGGMGVVFEATDLKLKRRVALKVIRSAQFATRDEAARFRGEMEAVARLDHPCIVPVYESGEEDGLPYFTMRLAEGGSLADLLRKKGPLSEREAVEMMRCIARAVQHAHDRGVLHRDLKPANILMDREHQPLLADFGLAKRLDATSMVTRSHVHVGTPHYMSPEQATGGSVAITTASDVWALGVLLCEMLTGRLPFDGGSAVEVMRRITQEEPDLASSSRLRSRTGERDSAIKAQSFVRLPPDLATLIRRCLDKDPGKRLRSAGFLADELDRFLAGEPLHSRPVRAQEVAWRWVKKHRVASAAVVVAVLSLCIGTVVSLIQAAEAHRALEVARQQQREADAISRMTLNTLVGLRTRSARGHVANRAEALAALLQQIQRFDGDPIRKARMLVDLGGMLDNRQTLEIYREAVRLVEGVTTPDDPMLWRFKYLAASQWCITDEDSEEALDALRGVLRWQQEHLKPEHLDTVMSQFALGKALDVHGHVEEAQELLKEVCRVAVKKNYKAFTLMNFRYYYLMAVHDSGRTKFALTLGRGYVEAARKLLGAEHVLTGEILALHAGHCLHSDLIDEARTTGREALAILWRTAGPEYVDARTCLDDMLELMRGNDGLEACLGLQREALRQADQWYGPLHWFTTKQAAACAELLCEMKRPAEGGALCQDWLERMRAPDATLPVEAAPLLRARACCLAAQHDAPGEAEVRKHLLALMEDPGHSDAFTAEEIDEARAELQRAIKAAKPAGQ